MAKPTPGPWAWFANWNGVYLATPHSGHLIVMDFVRRGMQGGTVRFADWKGEERERMGGIMRPATEAMVRSHPDARLIEGAPALLCALKDLTDEIAAMHIAGDHDFNALRNGKRFAAAMAAIAQTEVR